MYVTHRVHVYEVHVVLVVNFISGRMRNPCDSSFKHSKCNSYFLHVYACIQTPCGESFSSTIVFETGIILLIRGWIMISCLLVFAQSEAT